MTTEIAVSNQLGIALATDSAVTITGGGRTKVFNTADKLFELSATYPVAVMINGNMDFLGTPWEILVKDFRSVEGHKARGGIAKWAHDFLEFVSDREKGAEDAVGGFIDRAIIEEIKHLQSIIMYFVRNYVFQTWKPNIPVLSKKDLDISKILDAVIQHRRDILNKTDAVKSLSSLTKEVVLEKYKDRIHASIEKEYTGQNLSDAHKDALTDLILESLLRAVERDSQTGVIVAGYGADDTFPAVFSAELDGRVAGKLKVLRETFACIADCADNGMVTSFAQTDVIERLFKGADSRFVRRAAEFIEKTVSDAVTKTFESVDKKPRGTKAVAARAKVIADMAAAAKGEFVDTAAEEIKRNFSREFDAMIAMMPKQELIELAEALVSITAMERKATVDEGTVGGPVDVALITKHEGFVWIKRKHHFQKDLNPRYFWRKYGPPYKGVLGHEKQN